MDPLQDDQNEIVLPSPKRYKKAPPEPFVLPTIKNFGVIYSAKYSLPDLGNSKALQVKSYRKQT